jgi:hypothetical protein
VSSYSGERAHYATFFMNILVGPMRLLKINRLREITGADDFDLL